MIKQIKKILGFKQCVRCGNRNRKMYQGLFSPNVTYCFDCKDSEYEYGMWVYEESKSKMSDKICHILYDHGIPMPESDLRLVAKDILNLFKHKL